MTYLEDKINRFILMIPDMYYYGCLGYVDIYSFALIYFKNDIEKCEIQYSTISAFVHKEINSLIDLD